ncbi:DEAD/DEAH box helicase [Aeromicrobium camelliae]|uniref:DEAD/DEAH box helicase n=1 Tax=Aeromicrobium camelliae TaxID=1538144 RepID=UPI00140850AD|nr:DEAD/DEAH box helicase [Aeromicrobium camelliae]
MSPTAVQSAVIPDALEGRHVLGRARTGSGKTLAFGLPVLARLAGETSRRGRPRALIILPTRELATQVRTVLEPLAASLGLRAVAVYGGVPINRQIRDLSRPVDVLIATPGRLGDLLDRKVLTLDAIELTVLDEADHLCDLGFYKPVDALLGKTPRESQRLLLSATLDGDVDRLVQRHLPRHRRHELDDLQGKPPTMEHHVLVATPETRAEALVALMEANPRSIVFTRTRRGASRIARQLTAKGVESVDLHGDLDQRRRERNLAKFTRGDADVIVATDVAARGIHVDGIELVVHYDAPAEHKAYLHRSGRTARAGQKGTVVTMTTPEGVKSVVALQRKAGVEARHHDARTAPSPMTADALSGAGVEAPAERPARSNRPSGSNPSGSNGQRGNNRNRNRNRRRRPAVAAAN